jgi:hypothetical protein
MLESSGHIVIKGPKNRPGAHNADVITYDPESGKLYFFDNKIQTLRETASRANNLTSGRKKNLQVAQEYFERMSEDLSKSQRRAISKALEAATESPDAAVWVVANANPAEVTNAVKRISTRLAAKGVRLATIVDNRVVVNSLEDSIEGVRGAKKLLGSLGKSLPIAGVALSAAMASPRVVAANEEDLAYEAAMVLMGEEPLFNHQSVARELAIIAGEEGGGEAGGAAGAALGAWAWGWGAIPGAVVGGLVGDYAGGWIAASRFDAATELSDEQLRAMFNSDSGP